MDSKSIKTLEFDKIREKVASFAVLDEGKELLNALMPETKLDPNINKVTVDGKEISYQEYVYIIMNKPKGYISASNDKNAETVVDLVPKEMRRKNLFPAGRLDKDTTGMLIITDDGDFAHRMLSPKKHVEKVYKATLDGEVTEEMVENFRKGISFYDGTLCLSAKLLPNKENPHIARVIIREGKYHQVKKMFLTQGLTVKELHREQIGMLKLLVILGKIIFVLKKNVKGF